MAKKLKTFDVCIADALDNGKSQLEELRDEVRDVYDNMPESLQGGDRGQRLEECASTLDEVDNVTLCDELSNSSRDDGTDALGGVRFTHVDGSKRRMSRAARRDEAVALLRDALDAIQQALDEDDDRPKGEQRYVEQRDEIESTVDEVTSLCDAAESADFPGMYG